MSNEDKQIPCAQKPCHSRQSSLSTSGDPNAEVRTRPVLYTGVIWIGIVRRFLIPRTCGSSLPPPPPPVNSAQSSEQPIAKSVSNASTRPTDPKLLTGQSAAPALISTKLLGDEKEKKENHHLQIASLVSQIQEVSEVVTDQARRLSNDIGSLVQESKESTTETIHAIRSDGAVVLRYSAVSVSGLVGYLAGLRRGVGTRVVYCATGATAMAAICYPEETRHYNKKSLQFIRRCIVLGLSLVPEGPQKQLDTNNVKASKQSKSKASQDVKKKPKQTQTSQKQTQTTSGKPLTKSLGILDYSNKQEQTETKSKLTQPGDSRQELKTNAYSVAPNNYPTQAPSPYDSPPTPTVPYDELPLRNSMQPSDQYDGHPSHSSGRLSSEFQEDLSKSLPPGAIPHSPALPAPPKAKSSYNEDHHEMSQDKFYKIHLGGITEKPTNTDSDVQSYNLDDSFNTLPTNKTNSFLETTHNEQSSTNDTNVYLGFASTPEEVMVLEDNKDICSTAEGGKCDKNKNNLYNKKLSCYYLQKSEELTNSAPPGYDDLYSRRE